MPTLSIVKTDFGKFIKWGGIIIGILIVLIVALRIFLFIKELIFPTPPPAPTVSYGKLPEINFPGGIHKKFKYSVDTISGDLPVFSPSQKVYEMEQKGPDILAVQKASQKVSSVGFNSHPQQISDYVYEWQNDSPPKQNLILNIKLEEFNLSSNFLDYEKDLSTINFTDQSEPIDAATTFLNSIGLYPDDIDETKTKVDFFILNDGILHPTSRVVSSNVATVYFFQKALNKVPIVYPQGVNSSMKIMVGAGKLDGKILDGKFSHQNTLKDSSTYPIKTAKEAYGELQKGKGVVASYNGTDTNIPIKNVYLALYSEGKIQKYLTPVIVFAGEDNFVAYVPAVKDEWISK